MTNKIVVLFYCFFFLSIGLSAQNYTPVIINGEVFFKTELETSDGLIFAEVTVANFEKINGVLYSRVFFKRGFDPDMFIGHLREEPSLGKLYFRPLSGDEDVLVYDISLEVGDVINLPARWCDGIGGDAAEVVEIIEQEGKREVVFDRQVGEQDICETLRFIEGVGPNSSVIFPFFQDALLENGAAQRLCHASHSAIIFYPSNTESDFCGLSITPVNEATYLKIELFPNPTRDFIVLNLAEQHEQKYVSIFSMLGDLVWEGIYMAGERIDVSTFPDGVYHLIMNEKNEAIRSTRFVKY